MEQFDVPGEMKVSIDYSDRDLPASVRIFRPVVFKEGDTFFVVLGPDSRQGILGRGDTLKEAISNWDKNLQQRVMEHDDDDEVVKFIVHYLKWYRLNCIYSYINLN